MCFSLLQLLLLQRLQLHTTTTTLHRDQRASPRSCLRRPAPALAWRRSGFTTSSSVAEPLRGDYIPGRTTVCWGLKKVDASPPLCIHKKWDNLRVLKAMFLCLPISLITKPSLFLIAKPECNFFLIKTKMFFLKNNAIGGKQIATFAKRQQARWNPLPGRCQGEAASLKQPTG